MEMKPTGWELDAISSMMLSDKMSEVEMLLQRYPLCAWDAAREMFWVIRKYHPTMQVPPTEPNEFRYCLVCYLPSGMCIYPLPKCSFTKLTINPREGYCQIVISTEEYGDVSTNMNELGRKLLYGTKSADERLEIFKSLQDDIIQKGKAKVVKTEVVSTVLGKMKVGEFDDWWVSKAVEIPYWSGKRFAILFFDYTPSEDLQFMADADTLLGAFFERSDEDRVSELTQVLYQDCIDYVEDVWDEENDVLRELANLPSENDVWNHVTLSEIYLQRDNQTDEVQLTLDCDCAWDDEHGIRLVYNSKAQFVGLQG